MIFWRAQLFVTFFVRGMHINYKTVKKKRYVWTLEKNAISPLQGIITMVAAVLGTDFFEHCYTPLGEVTNIIFIIIIIKTTATFITTINTTATLSPPSILL